MIQIREFMGIFIDTCHQFLLAGRIYFLWFVIYSFVGWCYESAICSQIKYHKFINRGFLQGPWVPIYGAGAVINYLLIGWIGNVPGVFLAAMFTSGVVEYLTSYAMERLFHKRWWDYTRYRYNLNGRICLYGCIIFGAANVVLLRFVHPTVIAFTEAIPDQVLTGIVIFLYLLFMTDIVYTVIQMETIRVRIEHFYRQLQDRHICHRYMLGEQKEYLRICVEEKKDYYRSCVVEKKDHYRNSVNEKRDYVSSFLEEKKNYYQDRFIEIRDRCFGRLERISIRSREDFSCREIVARMKERFRFR
ncbi:MAG: putative ABC transporter permease [Lachnospiraceae bacterium]|nr:putative ABC transporter permease [Lachnospiraceae bacterium]